MVIILATARVGKEENNSKLFTFVDEVGNEHRVCLLRLQNTHATLAVASKPYIETHVSKYKNRDFSINIDFYPTVRRLVLSFLPTKQ